MPHHMPRWHVRQGLCPVRGGATRAWTPHRRAERVLGAWCVQRERDGGRRRQLRVRARVRAAARAAARGVCECAGTSACACSNIGSGGGPVSSPILCP